MAVTSAQVQELYVGLLGRAADKAGLDYWMGQLNATGSTLTLENLRANFVNEQAEYAATYGNLARADLVSAIYQNLFERTATAEEVNYWANGTVSADQMVVAFLNGASAADKQVVSNKVFVAETYSSTVGASYNAAAAKAVVDKVDGTAASVSAAIGSIAGGTLAGQVPALALINAAKAAQATVTSFETSNKATADALVAKIAASNKAASVPAATTKTDDINASSTYAEKVKAVVDDAALARSAVTNAAGGDKDTTVLVTRAATADKAVTTTLAALSTAEKAQASTYAAAIAKEATAKAGAATLIEKGSAIGGLAADASATAALAAYTGTAKTADAVYNDYVLANAAGRTAIDTAFKDSSFYATFKATAAKDAAYADAIKATSAAKNALDTDITDETAVTIGTVNGVEVKGTTDATAGSAKAQAYVDALQTKTDADALVVKAQTADADVASAKALQDAYAAVTDASAAAAKAVTEFNADGVSVHTLAITPASGVVTDVVTSEAGTAFTGSAVKDVFFFADSTKVVGASDMAITTFGAGDSIVLGSSYAYNSGALSTGNNNALEFFVVKSDSGVQIVLETSVAGSTNATTDATTGVVTTTTNALDTTAVITLTGVTVDHVSVANGVVSYV